MTANTHRNTHLLPLTLAFLMSGLLACSGGSEAVQDQAAKPAEGQATQGGAPAPVPTNPAPGAPGQTAPGQTAPGQAAPGVAPAPTVKLDTAKLPAVVARVNGQDVKKEEFLKEAQEIRGNFLQRGASADQLESEAFYKQVLDGLIARTLLESEARAGGVTVSDADIQKEIAGLRSQFPSPEVFDKAMAAQGLDQAKLGDNLKRQIMVRKFVETKVVPQGQVPEPEIKAFYDQNQQQMQEPERLHLRHILVKVDEKAAEADKQKARAKADSLLARAKGGEDFAKLATEGSDDPGSKTRGGDIDWIARGQTVEPFEKAAFALQKPNELSPVVETRFGYHVIQLLDRKAAGVAPYDQVKERIAAFLKQRQSQEKLQAHLQELRAKAKIETFI